MAKCCNQKCSCATAPQQELVNSSFEAASQGELTNCCCAGNMPQTPIEENCRGQMESCQSVCFTDDRNCPDGCTGRPVAMLPPQGGTQAKYERCCDPSGCCGLYPRCCRNPFWPEFAKPGWLCCKDLYKM